MVQQVCLTVDAELWHFKPDFDENITVGLHTLAALCGDFEIPLTIFVSPSSKGLMNQAEYVERLRRVISGFSDRKYVFFEPHLHMKGLVSEQASESDDFDKYSYEARVRALRYGRNLLREFGYRAESFRAGGYKLGDPREYYRVLRDAGFQCSSTVHSDSSQLKECKTLALQHGIREWPVTKFCFIDWKLERRPFLLSPDFAPFRPVIRASSKIEGPIVINYHSFKVRGVETVPISIGRLMEYFLYGFDIAFVRRVSKSCRGDSFRTLGRQLDVFRKRGFEFVRLKRE